MKKIFCIFVGLTLSLAVYSQSVMDYFPAQKGDYWIYESGNGTVTDGITVVGSMQQEDGIWCYLFQDITSFGNTSTLYGLVDNMVVELAFRNVLGKAKECTKPYPLVIAEPGITYSYNNGDDCRCTTEKTAIEINGKKYEDCILVSESLYVDGKVMRTQKSYYAKNIGLIYVLLINSEGKESVYKRLIESNLDK